MLSCVKRGSCIQLGNASFLPNVGDTRSYSTGCPIRVTSCLPSSRIDTFNLPCRPLDQWAYYSECLPADYCTFKVRHTKPLIQTTQTITQQVTNL